MKKILKAAAALMALLFIASGTISAQEKKQVEKIITVVTIDEDGVSRDTTIIKSDTLEFEGENLIIQTREGKRIIHRPGKESRMIFVESEKGTSGRVTREGMGPAWVMHPDRNEKEGVNYHLSVDGVTVTIKAPKEKAAEADQILKEVQKILMKK